jgi:hypothetical protein
VDAARADPSSWLDRPPYPLFLLGGSLAAAVMVLFCFTPRFDLWRGLDYPGAWFNPELNRAIDSLQQVANPFKPVTNSSNRVITWRLLFPLLAHYLHLPRGVYLALPFVGCLLVLLLLLHVLTRRTGSRRLALAGTVLAASTSWFFVSTGWLAYFDSWYMLGLCLVVFSRPRTGLAACCLTMPWIDERFILSLPLGLLLRGLEQKELLHRPGKVWLTDVGLALGITGVYLVVRFLLLPIGPDSGLNSQLQEAARFPRTVSRILDGLWNGLRLAWVCVVLLVWFAGSGRHWLLAGILGFGIVLTLASNLVAHDISRSAAVLLPAALAGLLRSAEVWGTARAARLATVLAAANLLLPAEHVLTKIKIPIRYLYAQIDRLNNPPPFLQAEFYLNHGIQYVQQDQLGQALHFFTLAIQLDPRNAQAHNNRGVVYARWGEREKAEADYDAALALNPRLADAYFNRAHLRLDTNQPAAALKDVNQALELAPPDWPLRAAAEQFRTKVQP